jgi:glycosyltransferase involved in cell wall biosynthesis
LLKPLIKAGLEHGHQVDIACADTGKMESLKQEGFNIFHIPFVRNLSPISNFRAIIHLSKLLKAQNYDIVHVHTPIAAALARLTSKLMGIKNIIYTAHGFYFHEEMPKLSYKFWYTVEKLLARYCTDYLLVQSKEDYDLCKKSKFTDDNRLIHLGNGVDVMDCFNPERYEENRRLELRRQLGIAKEAVVICFVGRLVKEKGIIELLESFHSVKNEKKQSILLLIGEADESERDQYTFKKIKQLINDHAIKALGFRNDVADLLLISDIFVLPSYREGLPRSIIEAMSMKLPVIATNIRGCKEEVIDGKNGYIIPVKNSRALTDALMILMENHLLRKEFGEYGRSLAINQFNEQEILDKQMKLFSRLENLSNKDSEGDSPDKTPI